jgi:MSHA pilin protein MshD
MRPQQISASYCRCQRGVSFIEFIIFVVIISTALIGILEVMNLAATHSSDPLIRKQALAIAESLLEEVELMPFSYCDPDDANAATALSAANCTAGMDQDNGGGALGPVPAGETRGSAASPFDNVADYAGFSMATVADIAGNTYPGYSATVTVTREGAALLGVPEGAALKITVTVDGPGATQVVLDGYRTRFSPRI